MFPFGVGVCSINLGLYYVGNDASSFMTGSGGCVPMVGGSDPSSIDSNCFVSNGFSWEPDSPSVIYKNETTNIICTQIDPYWGDLIFTPADEDCEDGNSDNGDGCENNCTITSGYTCELDSSTNLHVWDEVPVVEPTKTEETKSYGLEKMISQVRAASIVVVSVSVSSIKLSSPQELWSSIHLDQNLCLLKLSKLHFPDKVLNYMEGSNLFNAPIRLLSIQDIPGISAICKWLGSEVTDEYEDRYGLDSTSAVALNISTFFFLPFVYMVATLWVVLRKSWKCRFKEKKFFKYAGSMVHQALWNSIAIRTFMEQNMYIMVAWLIEIKRLELSSWSEKISFGLAIVMFLGVIAFKVLIVHTIYKSWNSFKPDEYYMFKEFFAGLKDKKFARLYPLAAAFRKLLFVLVVVMGNFIPVWAQMLVIVLLQLIYLILLVIFRPMEEISHNIIEVLNEVYFLCFVGGLVHLDKESKWSDTSETIYANSLIFHGFFIVFLTFGKPRFVLN